MKGRVSVFLLFLYTLLFSICKTLRLPNDWAEAHWLIGYNLGFVKRGLAGEIFGWFMAKNDTSIAVFSAAILVLLYSVLLFIAFRETFRNGFDFRKVLFYILFFASQYIVFSAHLIGYFDHVVFLLTFLAVYFIKKKQIIFASLITVFSIFIHEISFFILIPISVFALMISQISTDDFSFTTTFKRKNIFQTLQFLFLPILGLLFVVVIHDSESLSHAKVFNYLKQYSFIEEIPADSVASGFTKSFLYQWEAQSPHFFQRVFLSTCTVFYGIPLFSMVVFLFNYFDFKKKLTLFLLLIAVCFCPLLLHAIAYDTYRIWTFPFVLLFVAFWILQMFQFPKNEKSVWTIFELLLFVISLIFTLFIPNHLFDGEVERFSFQMRVLCTLPMVFALVFIFRKLRISLF